jgi:hypothetical protein
MILNWVVKLENYLIKLNNIEFLDIYNKKIFYG